MKKGFLLSFLVVVFLNKTGLLHAQESGIIEEPTKISYSEKIYLQLSSKVFTTGQTVWFKAIVTDVNQMLTGASKILHVELIDFDEQIIDKKLLKLEKGITNSFFDLNEELPIGRYMIRAYTRWNKNFETDLISREYIDVFAPNRIVLEQEAIRNVVITEGAENQLTLSAKLYPKVLNPQHKGDLLLHLDMDTKQDSIKIKKNKEGIYSFNYRLPQNVVKAQLNLNLDSIKLKNWDKEFVNTYSKTIVADKNYLDVQFFPEGGKLIDGLNSTIGIKILDYKNEGVELSGNILDEKGVTIGGFRSNTLGMGTFYLSAGLDKTYYAEIKRDNGITYKYKLPKVYKQGYVISLKTINNYFRGTVTSNFSKTDSLFVKVYSRGVLYHSLNLKSKDGSVDMAINKNSLPEGIVTFTVYNSKKEPVCERLVFNYRENNSVEISLKTNLSNYNQREKTIIDIQTKYRNRFASNINTSLLVLNKEQLEDMHINNHNIMSYFLLGSELKGKIENPKSYFDKNNKYRFYNMDALMLTQGWRNYIYKPSTESIYFREQPEKNLIISGTIGEYFNRKLAPKKPLTLSLMTFGKDTQQAIATTVDSTGRFKFNIADNYAKDLEYLVQTTNYKNKKKEYTINIDNAIIPPKINYEKANKVQLADSFKVFVEENIKRRAIEKSFEVPEGTIALDEIKLEGYNLTPERQKMMELHGPPDVVIENEELISKIDWSNDLFTLLKMNYPDDIKILPPPIGINVVGADFTFIMVDGEPVQRGYYGLLAGLPVQEIKSVEIIQNPKNARRHVLDIFQSAASLPRFYQEASLISIISIYSYANNGLFGIPHKKALAIHKKKLPSFTPQREFYVPKYNELADSDWGIPDLRSVVYWNPNIGADDKGEAKIEFYNADNTGEMLVIVESISEDGKLGYYETTYSVDENLEK